jgi:NAD(P)-dependent dehydrogenase (short-subunit alcohol dehydrogenase family)
MVKAAIESFGRLDIVICNAGLFSSTPFPDVGWDEMQLHFDVNVGSAFHLCRAAWLQMVEQQYGRIVTTTSAAVFGSPRMTAYATAKAGVFSLTRVLAATGRPHGIQVNALSPGALTQMTRDSRKGELATDPVMQELWRIQTPERVAPLVVALVHESCPETGQTYDAAGGRFARIFLGNTEGVFVAHPTPEDVAAKWAEIDDADRYQIRADNEAQREHLHEVILRGHAEANV